MFRAELYGDSHSCLMLVLMVTGFDHDHIVDSDVESPSSEATALRDNGIGTLVIDPRCIRVIVEHDTVLHRFHISWFVAGVCC